MRTKGKSSVEFNNVFLRSSAAITGFSNSMTSAALESKSEGIILGIMSNMFKLAGAVIVAGVVSAFIIGTIIFLFR